MFSRYVVGFLISERETVELAEAFIAETCAKEGIGSDQLTLHADRGSAMTSKSVAQLLAEVPDDQAAAVQALLDQSA